MEAAYIRNNQRCLNIWNAKQHILEIIKGVWIWKQHIFEIIEGV